jgi:hypothetical protein
MNYKVEFEVDGDSISYTVRAENVLEAEEVAKKKLKNDIKVRTKAMQRGSSTSSWKVKQIENIPEHGDEFENVYGESDNYLVICDKNINKRQGKITAKFKDIK